MDKMHASPEPEMTLKKANAVLLASLTGVPTPNNVARLMQLDDDVLDAALRKAMAKREASQDVTVPGMTREKADVVLRVAQTGLMTPRKLKAALDEAGIAA